MTRGTRVLFRSGSALAGRTGVVVGERYKGWATVELDQSTTVWDPEVKRRTVVTLILESMRQLQVVGGGR